MACPPLQQTTPSSLRGLSGALRLLMLTGALLVPGSRATTSACGDLPFDLVASISVDMPAGIPSAAAAPHHARGTVPGIANCSGATLCVCGWRRSTPTRAPKMVILAKVRRSEEMGR